MGSDATVFPFHFERYQNHVVPTIRRYVLHGQATVWLQTLISVTERRLPAINGTDLERFCHYLDLNLAWNTDYDISDTWFEEWAYRACNSTSCPERFRCMYHQNDDGTFGEELNALIESAVAALCVDEEQFVGRTMTVKKYWNILTQFNVPENDPLRHLLLKLGKRGFVIGYQWAGSAEGIHGWLNPSETQELAHRLLNLPLPELPASFEAMNQALQDFRKLPEHESSNMAFAVLSLALVRTVSTIAVSRNKGILWANDLINYPGYLPEQLSLED